MRISVAQRMSFDCLPSQDDFPVMKWYACLWHSILFHCLSVRSLSLYRILSKLSVTTDDVSFLLTHTPSVHTSLSEYLSVSVHVSFSYNYLCLSLSLLSSNQKLRHQRLNEKEVSLAVAVASYYLVTLFLISVVIRNTVIDFNSSSSSSNGSGLSMRAFFELENRRWAEW